MNFYIDILFFPYSKPNLISILINIISFKLTFIILAPKVFIDPHELI